MRVRETLASQIGSSVRWLDSMLFLLDQGVTEFEEVGPGSVLDEARRADPQETLTRRYLPETLISPLVVESRIDGPSPPPTVPSSRRRDCSEAATVRLSV